MAARAGILLAGTLLLGCASAGREVGVSDAASRPEVEIDLFVMSRCPAGVRAEGILSELKNIFGERVAVGLYYIADSKLSEEGELLFRSLRGSGEVAENIRQLLIAKHYPESFWRYLNIRNREIERDDWQSFVLTAGIDPEVIAEKIESGEGAKLLAANIEEQERGERWKAAGEEWTPPRASPTIYLNRVLYRGPVSLPSLAVAVNRVLGEADEGLKLARIPECFDDSDCFREGKIGRCRQAGTLEARCEYLDYPAIELVRVGSAGYPAGDKNLIEGLRRSSPGLTLREVASDSPEGKELIEELDLKFLPAYLFNRSIEEAESFEFLLDNQAIEERGDYYAMVLKGAREGVLLDRELEPLRLDLFVMSQCPFGPDVYLQLLKAREEGIVADEVEIRLHYIVDVEINPEDKSIAFSSLHGQPEAEEDMRQLCVMKYFPEEFADYLRLRNEEIRSTLWEKPALGAGVDPARIIACIYREGNQLLLENSVTARELKISSSPTFLWENRYLFFDPKRLGGLPGLEGVEVELEGSCE